MKTSFGLTANGFTANGLTANGLTANGLTANGLTANGLTANGLTANGFTANGLTANGFTANGLTANGFTANGLTANALETDPNSRALLQYIYSCAMTPSDSIVLFEGTPEALPLTGSLSLAPEWGASDSGSCNETCQRWISACVLARTNAYGSPVPISIRGSHPALALSPGETTSYPNKEGSYFGNIFNTTTSGTATVNAPELFACSGPSSTVPDQTMRFCSSPVDFCPIETVGFCSNPPVGTGSAKCTTLDPVSGAESDCLGNDGVTYAEVITVFLGTEKISACGNGACEVVETSASCPSDCKEGTFASRYIANGAAAGDSFWGGSAGTGIGADNSQVVVSPANEMIVGGPYLAGTYGNAPVTGIGNNVIAAYSEAGVPLRVTRFAGGGDLHALDVSSTGLIGAISQNGEDTRVDFFDASGVALGSISYDGQTTGPRPLRSRIAADGSGNWYIATQFQGTLTLPNGLPFTSAGGTDVIVSRLAAPPVGAGAIPTFNWAEHVENRMGDQIPTALAVNAAGSRLLITEDISSASSGTQPGLRTVRVSHAASGWVKSSQDIGPNVRFGAGILDEDGNAYVAGTATGIFNLGGGSQGSGSLYCEPAPSTLCYYTSTPSLSHFIVKYDAAGTYRTSVVGSGRMDATHMTFDAAGNLVLAGRSNDVDFGTGPFEAFSGFADLFVGSWSRDLAVLWTRQLPTNKPANGVNYGALLYGMDLTSTGRIALAGLFDGSLLLDSRVIINYPPPSIYNGDLFVAAVSAPCSTLNCDTVAPVQANVPANLEVAATTAAGATVQFRSPTAIDPPVSGQYDSARVTCIPATNSVFPIGVTNVDCKAYDSHGNFSTSSFTVTVTDEIAPNVAMPKQVDAIETSTSSAVVNFPAATAYDNVGGSTTCGTGALPATTTTVACTCDSAPGDSFTVGETTVSCSARDAAGNMTQGSFKVTVVASVVTGGTPTPTPSAFPTPAPDTTKPVVSVPGTIVTPATSANGAVVNYPAVTANDNKDGALAATCSKLSGEQFPLGTTTVVCSATDAAGNVGTAAFDVKVQLSWSGFASPINIDGSSVFKQGRNVPVKFSLTGVPAGTNPVANIVVVKVSNGVLGTVDEATSTWGADAGNTFRYQDGQYHYNLSTERLSPGTYSIQADLHDGVFRNVLISVRQ